MSKSRIQYLRNQAGQYVGCVAILIDRHNKRILHQVSVCNPVDRFDSKEGRLVALTRLLEEPMKTPLPRRNANLNGVTEAVMKSLAASKKVPSRASKAAKRWLRRTRSV